MEERPNHPPFSRRRKFEQYYVWRPTADMIKKNTKWHTKLVVVEGCSASGFRIQHVVHSIDTMNYYPLTRIVAPAELNPYHRCKIQHSSNCLMLHSYRKWRKKKWIFLWRMLHFVQRTDARNPNFVLPSPHYIHVLLSLRCIDSAVLATYKYRIAYYYRYYSLLSPVPLFLFPAFLSSLFLLLSKSPFQFERPSSSILFFQVTADEPF